MLWITLLVVLITVFTVMQANFGPRTGYRATIWTLFLVALALVLAIALRAGREDLSPLIWAFVGGAALTLILDRVGLILIDFGLEISTAWKRRKADEAAKARRQAEDAARNKAALAALFARHEEDSGEASNRPRH